VFTAEEMKVIATPTDFQGINIYTATPVRRRRMRMGSR